MMVRTMGLGDVTPTHCDFRWKPTAPCPDGTVSYSDFSNCTKTCITLEESRARNPIAPVGQDGPVTKLFRMFNESVGISLPVVALVVVGGLLLFGGGESK